MKQLSGIVPIVAAVFDGNGKVDAREFERLIVHLMGTGASGLTLFGLATEFYKLTDAEKEQMMQIMLRQTTASPDVAGIVSITHHSWEVAVEHAQAAEEAGADALMLLPPFFLKPSSEAIYFHMKQVVKSVHIPVIIQYAPNQTGVSLAPDIFTKLYEECGNAKFVKVETQPPGRYASVLHQASQGNLQTLVGYAGVQMADVLKRGSAGIQPGCSFTEIYVALYRYFQNNDMHAFNVLFEKLLPYISYWMQSVELIIKAEKVILRKRGLISSDYCRYPDYALDAEEMVMIDRFCTEFEPYLFT